MVRFLLRTLTPRPHLVARTAGGERECLRFSKQLALLAYLGARPDGAASREELVSLLWDGSAQRDARHALRQVIHQIRRHAEAELVHGDGALCVRREELEFDVVRFRQELAAGRLEDALALYETDFLSTVTVPDASVDLVGLYVARGIPGDAYALITDAALATMEIPPEGMTAISETYDDIPPVAAHVMTLD